MSEIRIRDAAQAAAFLESLVLSEPRSYAQRAAYAQRAVRVLLAQIGDPHRQLAVVHITGSKGKGSTALLCEAILRAAGLRVGTFTSPHLRRWTERYRIDGQEADGGRLAAALERLRPHVEALQKENPQLAPSFFDTATAAALLMFHEAPVDIAIVEVGLGGRLDATNVVEPRVSCITSIELEHTDKLGGTLAAIAREKAGIVKPGVPLVVGALPRQAAAVVERRAALVKAPLIQSGDAFRVSWRESATGALMHYCGEGLAVEVELALFGEHTAHNAALAIACIQQLKVLRGAALERAVVSALSAARLPGRCEILSRSPWVIVDSAHTLASIQALQRVLHKLPARRRHWVVSFAAHKDLPALCNALFSPGDRVMVTKADPSRSREPREVAAALPGGLIVQLVEDSTLAVEQAYRGLLADDVLCVTGSVYMAGLGREWLLERLSAAV